MLKRLAVPLLILVVLHVTSAMAQQPQQYPVLDRIADQIIQKYATTPCEQLAQMMDGTHTVARLVAEFARLAGRLAPDQVRRVVADLAGNRMLDELPVDAFRPVQELERQPLPRRVGSGVLAAARGRRMMVFVIDRVITAL